MSPNALSHFLFYAGFYNAFSNAFMLVFVCLYCRNFSLFFLIRFLILQMYLQNCFGVFLYSLFFSFYFIVVYFFNNFSYILCLPFPISFRTSFAFLFILLQPKELH